MKAAVLHAVGQVPQYEDFADPTPKDGEVKLKVLAASIKNVDKMMAKGEHYAGPNQLPAVCGVDGVGELPDGKRVYFANLAHPYGAMAEYAVVNPQWAFAVPDALDSATAAALPNPAMSSWMALQLRAKLQAGETVLVLGATGAAGRLAIQIAKHLGAGKVVAAGRGQALDELKGLGADEVVDTEQADEAAIAQFQQYGPYHVVLDYLWGHPAEVLLQSLTGHSLTSEPVTTRYIQIGESAGSTVALAAEALRSSGVELYGSGGGSVSREEMFKAVMAAMHELMDLASSGELQLPTEQVPLKDVEAAWVRTDGKRLVLIP